MEAREGPCFLALDASVDRHGMSMCFCKSESLSWCTERERLNLFVSGV